MLFEWDSAKEKKNITKHGISFSVAAKVFGDPFRIELFDKSHSNNEDRYITIGRIDSELIVLTVVYTERDDTIRLISARRADGKERRLYYDCS